MALDDTHNDLVLAKVLAAIIPDTSLLPQDPWSFKLIDDFAYLAERSFAINRAVCNRPMPMQEKQKLQNLIKQNL